MTILAELQTAAARKWQGDPACQQAGLFWRAVVELERLTAERDAFKQSLYAEMDENLRLRELGGAKPDEYITDMIERLIRERDALRAELHREHADHKQTLADVDTLVAAERARIDAAPVAIIDTRDVLGLCAPTEAGFAALYALQGHRVALVDLGLAKEAP